MTHVLLLKPLWLKLAAERGHRTNGIAGVSVMTLVMSQGLQSTKEIKLMLDIIQTLSCWRKQQTLLWLLFFYTSAPAYYYYPNNFH